MIKFTLHCDNDHVFEGWFASNAAFDHQAQNSLVECPMCGSDKVGKALMAPNVLTSDQMRASRRARADEPASTETPVAAPAAPSMPVATDPARAEMIAKLQEMSRALRANADHVGRDFAEEARKIHFGETPPRGIYGEASKDEIEALLDDGVGVAPLPPLPEDLN
jgi:hypothetical protein